VGATKPGKDVSVEVFRKGTTRTLSLKVGKMPDENDEGSAKSQRGSAKAEPNKLGLMLRELNPQERKKLSVRGGLLVTNSQCVAAQAGIRRGDVLLAVGDVEVQNQGQLNRLLDAIPAGKSVALRMMRGDSLFFVSVKTAEKK